MHSLRALLMTALCVAAPTLASADWPAGGKVVAGAGLNDVGFTAIQDAANGDLFVYTSMVGNNGYGWVVQRLTRDGDPAIGWPFSGVIIGSSDKSVAIPQQGYAQDDSAGFWWISNSGQVRARHVLGDATLEPAATTWLVRNTTTFASGAAPAPGSDCYVSWGSVVQRFTRAGTVATGWPALGKSLGLPSSIFRLSIAPDGAGGVLAMQDYYDVPRVVRMDANATLHAGWPVGGLQLSSTYAGANDWWFPQHLTRSGADHLIAAWVEQPEGEPYNGAGLVKLQRFHLNGTLDPAWPANGLVASPTDSLKAVSVIADGSGGVFVLWDRNGPRGTHVLANGQFESGLSAAGVSLLPAGAQYRRATWAAGNSGPPLSADRGLNGGLVFAWNDARYGSNRHIRVRWFQSDLTPEPSQPDSGQLVIPNMDAFPTLYPSLRAAHSDGAGGAYLAWSTFDPSLGSWPSSAAVLAMTHVTPAATLGVDPPSPIAPARLALRAPSPNPARGSVVLRFALPDDAAAQLELYDVTGRIVRSRMVQRAGEHTETFDRLGELAPGLYLVRLTHGQQARSARFVVMP